jgi:hypothetical protein
MTFEDPLTVFGYRMKDPTAPCDACGTTGTVGRAIKCQDGVEVFHGCYCADCWLEESARLSARWTEEANRASEELFRSPGPNQPSPPSVCTALGAATWHSIRDHIRDRILPSQRSERPPSAEYLATLAGVYRGIAPEIVGRMPFLVEDFIATYARSDRSRPDSVS